MRTCDDIKREYIASVTEYSNMRAMENGCLLMTPFIHFNGEFINVYFEFVGERELVVHDNGETISELYLNGLDVLARQDSTAFELLCKILTKFRFEISGWSIQRKTTFEEVGNVALDAINCIKSVFDLMFLHRAGQTDTFKSTVTRFLKAKSIVFSNDVRMPGKAVQHSIDYFVPSSSNSPQILMNVCHGKRTKQIAEHSAFSCLDLRDAGHSFEWVPIISPEDDWTSVSRNILETYSSRIVEWGRHEEDLKSLFNRR